MTVGDVIANLSKFPENADIVVRVHPNYIYDCVAICKSRLAHNLVEIYTKPSKYNFNGQEQVMNEETISHNQGD
jgi:hypothetical protein